MSSESKQARTLLMRVSEGTDLPDGLSPILEDEAVAAGVLRGHGILVDASLRVYSPLGGGMGTTRTLAGESQLVMLDGTIGMAGGHPTAVLRAVLARETEMGVETFAGTLVAGRVVQCELVVLALDDVALAIDDVPAAKPSAPAVPPPPRASQPERPPDRTPSPWAEAVRASAPQGPAPGPKAPPRAPRPAETDDGPFPDHGDLVDHFAFGMCEVLKSDGDRIHLKVGKDGRIREIALEMLKVTLKSEPDERPRRFRLERKL